MKIVKTHATPAERLRGELNALGLNTQGSRSELVHRLKQAGVYDINQDVPALSPCINAVSCCFNNTCVYIGHGAGLDNVDNNQLIIANNPTSNLITGDFKKNIVKINDVFQIESTENMNPDTHGEEGHVRRSGSNLYVYRKTDVHEGWYPIQFGPILIV